MKSQLLQSCQGCAPSTMGYLYHCHPLAASTSGGRHAQRYPQPPHSTLFYIQGAPLCPPQGTKKPQTGLGLYPPQAAVFFTGVSWTFFTAAGRFLNRGGCCRHAAHDGGNAGMGPTGNSYIHTHKQHTLHDVRHVSSGNSVGVAIPQPRVAGEARYPG